MFEVNAYSQVIRIHMSNFKSFSSFYIQMENEKFFRKHIHETYYLFIQSFELSKNDPTNIKL